MWALLGLTSGSAGGTSSGHAGSFGFCRGARAAPGAALHCRCAQKEFCCLLLFQISSGQGMGTCMGTEVSPSLQRSSGSAEDSVAQCGLQGSPVCKPLWCSSMGWCRTSLLSTQMCDAAPLTVVEVWETFPYPSAKLSHGNTPPGEHSLCMWLCRKSRLEGCYGWGAVSSLPSGHRPWDDVSSSELSPGALALCDSTCASGFLPRSLAATSNTFVPCSCCVLAERVDFLSMYEWSSCFPWQSFQQQPE